jgi:glycerophosphoryl diester phosphodiesterase
MEEILSSGSKLWINTLWASLNGGYDDTAARLSEDEDRVYGPLLEMGASMLQTDRPEALIRYLEEKGRRSF